MPPLKTDKNKTDKNKTDKNETDKNETDKNKTDKNKTNESRTILISALKEHQGYLTYSHVPQPSINEITRERINGCKKAVMRALSTIQTYDENWTRERGQALKNNSFEPIGGIKMYMHDFEVNSFGYENLFERSADVYARIIRGDDSIPLGPSFIEHYVEHFFHLKNIAHVYRLSAECSTLKFSAGLLLSVPQHRILSNSELTPFEINDVDLSFFHPEKIECFSPYISSNVQDKLGWHMSKQMMKSESVEEQSISVQDSVLSYLLNRSLSDNVLKENLSKGIEGFAIVPFLGDIIIEGMFIKGPIEELATFKNTEAFYSLVKQAEIHNIKLIEISLITH